MNRYLLVAMVALTTTGLICFTTGCSGGGGDSWPMEGEGELTWGDRQLVRGPVDVVFVTARRDGYITVRMDPAGGAGSLADPYIVVCRCSAWEDWDYSPVVGTDDDSGPGLAASLSFWATRGTTYAIGLSTYRNATGRYWYRIGDASTASAALPPADPQDKCAGEEAPETNRRR